MNIALVVPVYLYKYRYPAPLSITDFPTGFAYLASALSKAGHNVIGLNLNNKGQYSTGRDMLTSELSRTLKGHKPDVIGLGGLCTDYTFLSDAIAVIRSVAPNTPIVLGGNIVTNDAETVTNLLHPDFAIVGEAEESLVVLLAKGISGKGQIIQSPLPDVDSLPLPSYEPFDVETMIMQPTRYLYRYPRLKPRPFVLVSARDCVYNCTFCVHESRKNYRARDIDKIMEEIRVTYEKYEYNILVILDELFAVNKARLKTFCERLIEAREKYRWDFGWIFQTHANANLDVETLKLAKEAGCYCFSYGLESASDTILKSMRKHSKVAQITQAIDVAKQAEVGFSGNLIFGDPAETVGTVRESLQFLVKHGRDCHIFLGNVQPYPGSYLYDHLPKHDAKAYYETIDEQPFNLTKIADRFWIPWVYLALFLSTKCGWAKSVKASSSTRTANGIILNLACPHCHRLITVSEPANILAKEVHRRVSLLSLFRKFLLGFYHPLYRLLLPLIAFRRSIISGCPSCNARIRVKV